MRLEHLGHAFAAFSKMRLAHFGSRRRGSGPKTPTFWSSPASAGSSSSTDPRCVNCAPAVQQSLFNPQRQIAPVIRADAVEEVPSLKVVVDCV